MSDKLIMSNKFILLIDGDNFSPNCVKFMIDDIKSRGDIIIKKVYGDFSSKAINWKNSCYEYQIEALQVWSRNRKQATDNRLLTDGVEMICNYPNFTHIAIASGVLGMLAPSATQIHPLATNPFASSPSNYRTGVSL